MKINYSSKKWVWTGRILSILSGGFMLFDATIPLLQPPVVIQSYQQGGYSLNVILPLALIEFACIILYAIPRTSAFGALLLTGYLGGAVDYNVRAGNPLLSITLAPVYVAILL